MPLISVIIPLAPGETEWQLLLPQLLSLDIDKEILLLCADTHDVANINAAIADGHGVKVYPGKNGRAALMNKGAEIANGEYLWFLHADSVLPDDCAIILEQVINAQKPALYYFDLQFLPDGPPWMPVNNSGVYFRSRYLKMPFGDQGFFLAKSVFEKIGPYNAMAKYGEDHLLVWQAHHSGIAVLPIGARLMSSARKYHRHGWLKTTLKHVYLTARQALPQWVKLMQQRLFPR